MMRAKILTGKGLKKKKLKVPNSLLGHSISRNTGTNSLYRQIHSAFIFNLTHNQAFVKCYVPCPIDAYMVRVVYHKITQDKGLSNIL
jgi:hypothetical protein